MTIIDTEINDLLQNERIEPSNNRYSSPLVVVKKKEPNKWWLCVDFRQINKHSIKDTYPLPHIEATLNKLRGTRFISTLDLKQGYWQIPLVKQNRQYTAFTVPGRGLFQWTVMSFGLHSAQTQILGPCGKSTRYSPRSRQSECYKKNHTAH